MLKLLKSTHLIRLTGTNDAMPYAKFDFKVSKISHDLRARVQGKCDSSEFLFPERMQLNVDLKPIRHNC